MSEASPLTQIPEEQWLEETLRDFETRILALERRLSDYSRRSPRKALSTLSKESSAVLDDPPLPDLSEELKANHAAVLSELEGLRDIYDQAVSAAKPEEAESPRKDVYVNDLLFRVGKVEEEVAKLWTVKESLQDFEQEAADLRQSAVRRTELEVWVRDIEHLKVLFATLSEELEETTKSLTTKKSQEETVQKSSSSRMATIQEAAKQISSGIQQKSLLADIGALLSAEKPLQQRQAEQPKALPDSYQLLERQLHSLFTDLEKQKSSAALKYKEIDELEQHLERHERLTVDSIKRLQGEVNSKIESFASLFSKDADDPEGSKSLASLRSIIIKLQKDVRDLHSAVESLANAATPELKGPTVETDDAKGKYVTGLVQKHESLLRAQSTAMKQMAESIDSLQSLWRKHTDSQALSRLGEMEEFKVEIAAVTKKVEEGVRLSQKDLEKLNELYDKVETKGDKAEIAVKADRAEVKKAYKALAKKIEQFRDSAKRGADSQSPSARDEPAATTRKLEVECLSCGQEVAPNTSPFRDSRIATHSSERRLNRFGHGFSKLLPMLNTLASKEHHRRVFSDAVSQQSIDKAKRLRLRTQESERGLSTGRRKSTSTTPNRG